LRFFNHDKVIGMGGGGNHPGGDYCRGGWEKWWGDEGELGPEMIEN
jgi:hypothetical protein